jgi:hypothetical protein
VIAYKVVQDQYRGISTGNFVGWLAEQWQEARKSARRSQIGGEGLPSRYLSHMRAHRRREGIFFSCAWVIHLGEKTNFFSSA